MSTLLPLIEQFHNARRDAERARLLLTCPASILMKYSHVFGDACARARFEDGADYVGAFVASMHAVRGEDGFHLAPTAEQLSRHSQILATIAAHGSARDNEAVSFDPSPDPVPDTGNGPAAL